jgi:transposase
VVEAVRQPPHAHGLARARWRLGDLAAVVDGLAGYSRSGVSRALRRLKVSRQRGRLAVHSPDPAYRAKLAWVARAAALARRPDSGVTVLYGDEFSLHRQPTLAATYAPRRQAPVARLSHRANTRQRISGALDLATGQVTWLARSKMGVANLKRFLAKLRRAYPRRRLVLIWDNWPVHLNPAVLETASALGIELLWLPTYAPWTNPIEKLWRWLKQDQLHHHRLADRWPELQAEVGAWLDQFAGPSPALLRYVGLSD